MKECMPTVLIVDDDPKIRSLLQDVLEGEGYSSTCAENADDALNLLQVQNFELALVAVKLPGTSGMELLKSIRASYPDTSVAMVTALDDTKTAVEAMRRGARDYILKPFSRGEISARVATMLREKAMRGAGGVLSEDLATTEAERHMWAIAKGVEIHVARLDMHDRVVAAKTVEVARSLSIPEEAICSWVNKRRLQTEAREQRMQWVSNTLSTGVKMKSSGKRSRTPSSRL